MADTFNSQYLEDSSFLTYSTISADQISNNLVGVSQPYHFNEKNQSLLRYFGTQCYNMNIKGQSNLPLTGKFSIPSYNMNIGAGGNSLNTSNNNHNIPITSGVSNQLHSNYQPSLNQYGNGCLNRIRYAPYQCRSYSMGNMHCTPHQPQDNLKYLSSYTNNYSYLATPPMSSSYINNFNNSTESLNFNCNKKVNTLNNSNSNNTRPLNYGPTSNLTPATTTSSFFTSNSISSSTNDLNACPNGDGSNQLITLQINNLDYSLEENQLRSFLLNQLKPITPVLSLNFEGSSCAKVTVPDLYYAKQVVSNLHRKKIGHKRMVVSYTRDSSSTEINTLRCQVAGLLKDVPYCTLPMYKFRELFQSRFKTSISVLDLYKMQDICSITTDKSEDKHISLNSEVISSIESNPLIEGLQESVPYCSLHFKQEQHKGWAEQEIEPLPNVYMTILDIKQIIYPLLKSHSGDIPVSSLVHCIVGELGIQINRNENGVNLEHLICCVHGIQISNNNFGIKILGWLEPENAIGKEINADRYSKSGANADPLFQISKEVVELVKMSPKSTMKFNRFIPAYHNHFGKQCRVADYGYTKLIELFEALSSVIQIMGDGENRQITLTHRTQIRRFTTDLLRIIRTQGNKSIYLSQLPEIFSQTQNRLFDITDYGVCSIDDILDGLANSNIIVITPIQNGNDILISIPKRKQTPLEVEKTCVFAGEVVDLFRNAPQYSILFQKFVRSYHYHFGYQCRLSDYGFLKLADLMEAIQGVVEIEFTNDEDKKIFLSPKSARRVFAEQLEELIKNVSGSPRTCMKLDDVLNLHKKKYGYQIQSQTLGFANIIDAIKDLPYVEIIEIDGLLWIICHLDDAIFRKQTYMACRIILDAGNDLVSLSELINLLLVKYNETITENTVAAMKHAVEIKHDKGTNLVVITRLIKFIINIVKLMEQHKILALCEIKKYLNITLGDCFEFGYPNLFALIRGHPDIFNCEIASAIDRSKISLVSSCQLISYANYIDNARVQHSMPNKLLDKNTSLTNQMNNQCQPLSSYNRATLKSNHGILSSTFYDFNNDNSMKQYIKHEKENQFVDANYQQYLQKSKFPLGTPLTTTNNIHQQYQQIQNPSAFYNNKENSFNASFNSSSASVELLNSSSINVIVNNDGNLSLSNGSANSGTSSDGTLNISSEVCTDINKSNQNALTDFPKLWNNGNIDYFNKNINYSESDDIFGLLKTSSTCPIYEISNSESTSSDILPFWIDPIWTNDANNKTNNGEDSPKNDSINIDLPELKTFNIILPMLLSPYPLLESENMKKNMFSFDSPDKKIT